MGGIRIYIVTHNAKEFPEGEHFQPIQSGRALNPLIEGTIGDDSGDNISLLNPFFAEIAPMYWAWKNAEPTDIVGFFHYRRFLNFGASLAPGAHWMDRNFHDFTAPSIARFHWGKAEIEQALEGCDIALPEHEIASLPPYWQETCSLYQHYRNAHGPAAINLALQVLKEVHPEDALLAEEVMSGSRGYFCHMYVMRWNIFTEYMAWIFKIFNAMQPRIDLTSPFYAIETGQQRIFGFVGERFFNIYIEKMKREGKIVKEFERLFGLVQASPGKANPPTQSRKKMIQPMHRGVELNVLGRTISAFVPD